MSQRWHMLALFFAVRTTMAFQFQSVGASGPLVGAEFGIGVAELGLLIGLYQSPGMVLALPSGALSRRFGDKRCVLVALGLMTVGGLVMGTIPSWGAQIAGRLVAGFGGVTITVILSKMVADWFSTAEIATAMGLYVNSWTCGIAIALVIVPLIAPVIGVRGVYLLTAGATAAAAVAFLLLYHAPASIQATQTVQAVPAGGALVGVILAGLIWGLFNAAVTMVFSFGNSMLVEHGWQMATAGSVVSLTLWMMLFSVPTGGLIADRTGRPGAVLVGGFVAFAVLLGAATRMTELALPIFVAVGLVAGLPGGPVMSLPARVLTAPTRAFGMAIFWTVFYVTALLAPMIAGFVAKATGSIALTFDLGIVSLVLACTIYAIFNLIFTPVTITKAAQ